MERNIVQIGNSMGVILPASILKRLNLSAKDPVTITHRNNSIIIKPVPRRNWEAAASQMHAAGDDNLLAFLSSIYRQSESGRWLSYPLFRLKYTSPAKDKE